MVHRYKQAMVGGSRSRIHIHSLHSMARHNSNHWQIDSSRISTLSIIINSTIIVYIASLGILHYFIIIHTTNISCQPGPTHILRLTHTHAHPDTHSFFTDTLSCWPNSFSLNHTCIHRGILYLQLCAGNVWP